MHKLGVLQKYLELYYRKDAIEDGAFGIHLPKAFIKKEK